MQERFIKTKNSILNKIISSNPNFSIVRSDIMPKCSICGKELQNPNSIRHVNSAYHQKALQREKIPEKRLRTSQIVVKDTKLQKEIKELKEVVIGIEKRVKNLEYLITKNNQNNQYTTYTDDDTRVIENSIIRLIKDISSNQRIKGMVPIKNINKSIKKEFKIKEDDFINLIMRLYRKQMIDLQPGGNPRDYHLKSPTGSDFYYVSLKK